MSHKFDLEERTFVFAQSVRLFITKLPRTITNIEDIKQLARSSGSVGANYIEANESISKKDFAHRIKVCRKEAKETKYWLKLLFLSENESLEKERAVLLDEAMQLVKIFNAIIEKSTPSSV